MPAGNPLGYAQPQGQGGGISPQLIQMMMQMLQTAPQQPTGGAAAGGMPPTAVPSNLRVPTETEQLMNMLLQGLQMPQAGTHAMNAAHGMAGAPAGALGGRPRGS